MKNFSIDPELENNSFFIADLDLSRVYLKNDKENPLNPLMRGFIVSAVSAIVIFMALSIYLLGEPGGKETHYMDQPLRILEIATGRDVKMINNFESNGDLFVVENGKRIIGEVGF